MIRISFKVNDLGEKQLVGDSILWNRTNKYIYLKIQEGNFYDFQNFITILEENKKNHEITPFEDMDNSIDLFFSSPVTDKSLKIRFKGLDLIRCSCKLEYWIVYKVKIEYQEFELI